MKQNFRKIIIILILFFNIGYFLGNINTYAKNNKVILSEKYDIKKTERIKESIKQKNNYRFLIKTTDSFNTVKEYFKVLDKKVKVRKYSNNKYMIRLSLLSDFLVNDIININEGILPKNLGKYTIIQPEIVEGFAINFVSGEENSKLWGNNLIQADLFQEKLSLKEKIKVGVLDTGIDYTHRDLDGNYNSILSYDFVNKDNNAIDDNGHGTQVAGIIGAEVNGEGRYGVNSNADLVGLKVLDANGIGTTYDILEAIEYAKLTNIKVLNMSFGGVGNPSTSIVCDAITDAKNNGIFTIVPVGNNNSKITNLIPASCTDSITVGSIDDLNKKANFSNYGSGVTLYTPGVNIYTTNLANTYKNVSGTSFSAGFVSGLVAKELTFSGSISYDSLINNLKNSYNLIQEFNINSGIVTNNISNGIKIEPGIFVLEENFNLFNRFNDFTYLSLDDSFLYFSDKLNEDKIYKLKINNTYISLSKEYYLTNPKSVFSNKGSFMPFYFNSGIYINLDEYNNAEVISKYENNLPSLQQDQFSTLATSFQSLGKYEIDYKFDQISGEKIMNLQGYPSHEDEVYLYYNNRDDYNKLYRIKKDGSELATGGTKILNISYTYISIIDDEYIYYQNRDDNFTFYRIKKDGSELATGGTKIINIKYSYSNYEDGTYIYYQNRDDFSKLYRIKKDGSELATGGTKIIDTDYSYPRFYEGGYVYYQNRNDGYKLYKIKQDGSEITTGGIKISDNRSFGYIFNDLMYIYYLSRNHIDGGLYRIKKDGSESNSFGTKILNSPEGGFFMMRNIFDDKDFIYYTDMGNQNKIYRIKKDGSELNLGATKISDTKYSSILFLEGEYIYYRNGENNSGITRIKKDGSELTSGGISINNAPSYYYKGSDLTYIYFLNYTYKDGVSTYSYYKVKKDGTDKNLYFDKNPYKSPGILLDDGVEEIKIKIDYIIPEGTNYKFYLSDDNSNYIEVDKILLNGKTKINLNNILGLLFNKTIYYKIQLIGNNNTQITPEINYVEISLGNEEINYISDIKIIGSNGCSDGSYHTAYLSLYKTDSDGNENEFYTNSQRYYDSTIGCRSGGWLWGSRYTKHTCELIDITANKNTSLINYKCTIYESRSGSAAGGSGWSNYSYKYGSFTIDNDICSYDESLCVTYVESHIQPGETIINYLSRINEGIVTNPISTPSTQGDPVNLNTGEFTYDNVVMQNNSKGFPFEFGISYKNKTVYDGVLGYNFDYSYNKYLVEQSDGNIYYYNGKLGVFEFIKNDTGFDYNSNINAELKLVDGKYNLIFNNSKTYIFNTDLKIESISDNFGNTFSFNYNIDGNLEKIIDSDSREYTLIYNSGGKLENITDFKGSKVDFIYYGAGETDGSEFDLKTIKMINNISEKEINFTYTIGDTDEDSHNIIKLIDSENNIYVENSYDEFDRVSSQKYGNGTINYTYTVDSDDKIIENSVVDREGHNVIYTYDTDGNTIKKVVKKASGDSIYSYDYNSDNYITKEMLPLGNGYTFKYDDNHNLIEKRQKADIKLADSNDDIVTSFSYDTIFNKITQIINPNGLITNFILDGNGNIIKKEILGVKDIDGNTQAIVENYEYNNLGELVKKIDANGNTTSFEYINGNLVKSYKPLPNPPLTGEGISTEYNYDINGNIISITDGEGNITNLSYDDFNMLKKLTTSEGIISEFTYNKLNKKTNESIILGNLSKVTSSYEYDILDNPTNITTDIDLNKQKITVTKYDKNSNITEIKDGNNAIINFEYDSESYIIKKIIKSIKGDIITSYIYDENNRLIKQINPNNSEIIFEYDLYDRIVKQTLSNGVYTILSYDKAGNILETSTYSSTGELLQTQKSIYDKLNRTIQKINPILSTGYLPSGIISFPLQEKEATSYFDAVGNIVKIVDEKGNITIYNYDNFNRLIKVVDKLGNTITNTYNKNDKLISRSIVGTELKTITTNYSYDSDNRLISETNSLNQTVSYKYNNLNQIISKTDKSGISANYKYDYRGNILEEKTADKIISYEYDINGNKTKVIDSNNNETIYVYDDLNRLIKQIYPDGNSITFEYDINGNLIKRIDPNGTIVNNNYDSLNRLISRNIQTGSGVLGITSETYSYDELGRLINGNDNQNNELSFSYDSLNRLESEVNGNNTIDYNYDISGNITKITSPQSSPSQGEEVATNYIYDINNRLLEITRNNKKIANYEYDSLNKTKETLGNGITTNFIFDELNRLSSLSNEINNYNYTYNTNGNITSNGIENYSYDYLNQITEANYGTRERNKELIEKFSYDSMGNRSIVEKIEVKTKGEKKKDKDDDNDKKEKKTKQEIDIENYFTNNLNQYTSIETEEKHDKEDNINFIYDNNGNLKQDEEYKYFYDYKNRLIKVEKVEEKNKDKDDKKKEKDEKKHGKESKIVSEYTYDILGRRIEKKTKEELTRYYYAGNNAILEKIYEIDDEELKLKETREHIYSNQLDDILATIVTKIEDEEEKHEKKEKKKHKEEDSEEKEKESKIYYYSKNHLGSIVAITDKKAKVIEKYTYNVFGKAYISHGKKGEYKEFKKSKVGNTRLYTGREYDREIGLYYLRARYYNADTGRFISRDPIDIRDDVNLYGYVGNGVVMYVDRSGKEKKLIDYMLSDEYINILRNNGSIAGIDAIFIEAKRLSNNDINLATEWFAGVLKGTINEELTLRQPLELGQLEGRDKIWHFATAFDLTYNKGLNSMIVDTIGILWEIKDIAEPLFNNGNGGYSQNDIYADRYGIEFAIQLKSDPNILPSDILNKGLLDTYLIDIDFNLIPKTY